MIVNINVVALKVIYRKNIKVHQDVFKDNINLREIKVLIYKVYYRQMGLEEKVKVCCFIVNKKVNYDLIKI